jgi:hypothetical protein
LYAIIALLAIATTALGMYAERLRWRNAFISAGLASIKRQQATAASVATAAATATPPPPTNTARALSADQRAAMLEKLRAETGAQKDVWFASAANDSEAAAYQRMLQSVFEEAGWRVVRSGPAAFPLRPGVFFLMADSAPPPYVSSALSAFQAGQITVSSGRDYRAFNERKKRDDPNWRGFEMGADEHYIVAVGPMPRE